MVKPSQRREMAKYAVQNKVVSIRLACIGFAISETCYRYRAKLSSENAKIADLLIRPYAQSEKLGLWLMLSVFTQCEGILLEPQESIQNLL